MANEGAIDARFYSTTLGIAYSNIFRVSISRTFYVSKLQEKLEQLPDP